MAASKLTTMTKPGNGKKLTFLLIGKTGHGKSATGNSLLLKQAFTASASTQSVTKEVTDNYAIIDDDVIHVVDGPGLSDTDSKLTFEDKERAAVDMSKALALCNGNVNAFLLVIKFGERFTDEMVMALNTLCQIFGPKYFNHVIVVISFGNLFQEAFDDKEITEPFDQWCKREYSKLYEACHGRFVLFHNKEKNNAARRNQIMHVITLTKRFGTSYTSTNFEEAKKERDRMILELKMPILNEGIQASICVLHGQVLEFADQPTNEGQEDIKEFIHDVLVQVESEDKGTGLLDKLKNVLKKLEDSLMDRAKLKAIVGELESVRQKKSKWKRLKNVCIVAACLTGATILAPVVLTIAAPIVIGGGALGAAVLISGSIVAMSSAASTARISTQASMCSRNYENLDSQERILTESQTTVLENIKETEMVFLASKTN